MRKLAQLAALVALVAVTSGCVKRQILSFEDHPTQPVTALEALETRNYLFWLTVEHQFFMCQDQTDKLVCSRTCGGKNDIVCPEGTAGGANVSSNVR